MTTQLNRVRFVSRWDRACCAPSHAADTDRINFDEYGTPDTRWNIVDGDVTLMPGLDLVLTRRPPARPSAVARLPDTGVKILVGDVAALAEVRNRDVLEASVDDTAALASIGKLKAISRQTGGDRVPLEDPNFMPTARFAPDITD